MRDWSEAEIQATVEDYFSMLTYEMRGVDYNKSEHRAVLMGALSNRSKGAVELKHQNISAILNEEGLRFIEGYKPRGNYQKVLRNHVLQYVKDQGLNIRQMPDKEDAFSWSILNSNEAIKRVDKSVILYHGTGVPKQVLPFFGIDDANPPKSLRLSYRGKVLRLRVSVDPFKRVRLFWPKALSDDISKTFPIEAAFLKADDERGQDNVVMHFYKRGEDILEVDVYALGDVVEEQVPEEYTGRLEGQTIVVQALRRARSIINRQKAIECYGVICAVCSFDFEKVYGELGRDFIEIHHLTPLGESDEEMTVNPKTDLIPLCANCHRMIHRGKDGALSLHELRLALMGKMA